jgi:Protein of unknown function (DUF2637)
VSAADRAIRASATVAVLGVAGIAAYISYWHAYEVISAHGENGVTARLEPATIDGLVYCSSMVVLYAARHQLRAPALARWLLGLGIVATLAANMAHGWSHGPIGATVAAWPAASLVGSYELLLWLIRSAASGGAVCGLDANPAGEPNGQPATALRLASSTGPDTLEDRGASGSYAKPGGPSDRGGGPVGGAGRTDAGRTYRPAVQETVGWCVVNEVGVAAGYSEEDLNVAAVAAYSASIDTGKPLSERKLAAMFGKNSRRWARNRMADARRTYAQGPG